MIDTPFHSGFIAVVGRPNVGKSTLVNVFLGQKIAAVSPRPQTTRRRQLGILTRPGIQAVFVDTPGLHIPHHKLGEFMNSEAEDSLRDVDCILWVVDASDMPTEEDELVAARIKTIRTLPPVFLVLNKMDLAGDTLPEYQIAFLSLLPEAQPFAVSASRKNGCDILLEAALATLPEGEPFYEEEQVTDLYEREIAADLIREAALLHLRDEVPHAIAVRVDEFTERPNGDAYIAATLFVERESHKGIVIGQGGTMIRTVGTAARHGIEEMSGRKVYLELRVKVSKNWRSDPQALRQFGYLREE